MTTWNPTLSTDLARQYREDNAKAASPWIGSVRHDSNAGGWSATGPVHREVADDAPGDDNYRAAARDLAAVARMRMNARAVAEQLEAADAEIRWLTECMEVAGLVCFMRGRPAVDVADHMRIVAKSWDAEIKRLTSDIAISLGTEAQAVQRCEHATEAIRAYLAALDAEDDDTFDTLDVRLKDLRDVVALAQVTLKPAVTP